MSIQQLLEVTVSRNASDIHLVAGYLPALRIHGDLIPLEGSEVLTAQEIEMLINPLMTADQKTLFETNLELDFSFSFQDRARFRVNLYRQKGSLSADLRMIPAQIPVLDNLGVPDPVKKFTDLKQGLILVTGPTGHGKSTTLAAILNQINIKRPVHILSIEDPIEYVYPLAKAVVSQREMYHDTKSWSQALRAALREDPDVVLVGEMRDYETIAAAITVAETGHLVFATLHTNSAAQSIDRMIDVFPENQQPQIRLQLAQVIEAVLSQRLIPTILPGRALACELLLKTPALGAMIRDGKTHLIDNLIQTSAELGMVSLEHSLAQLVKEGRLNIEVAHNYALRPDFLSKLIGS